MTIARDLIAGVLESRRPWLEPYDSMLRLCLEQTDAASVADVLNAHPNRPSAIRFVTQAVLPQNEPYESFIARTQTVPTRDNLHDFFNGLMWLRYPVTKRRLNVLQAREIERRGVADTRGALRDALTILDENAAILRAPEPLVDALLSRNWQSLFLDQRHAWRSATLLLIGHALMEKLTEPRTDITAHVWVVESADDDRIAASLLPERLAAKPFLPLPVLGVPGWWDPNADPAFYADARVFRPPR